MMTVRRFGQPITTSDGEASMIIISTTVVIDKSTLEGRLIAATVATEYVR
jgi:hypothetical protein